LVQQEDVGLDLGDCSVQNLDIARQITW